MAQKIFLGAHHSFVVCVVGASSRILLATVVRSVLRAYVIDDADFFRHKKESLFRTGF